MFHHCSAVCGIARAVDLRRLNGRAGEHRLDRGFPTLLRKPHGNRNPAEIVRQLNRLEGRRHRGVDPLRIEQRDRIQPGIDAHHLEFEPPHRDEEITPSGSVQFPGAGARLARGDLHARNAQTGDDPETSAGIRGEWCEGQSQSGAGIVGTGHLPTISRWVV